ncbi:MAG: NAD(+) synthase, partial [Bdellovibrionales bacterium]|nr:NAD(+) synthase [Bdellovibrionales bacterium]NQZ19952.1 NAD(+) synthase [Bdellovibrionales bacterium]
LEAPIVYVNAVGAQDEIIFDGGSFALNSKGKVLAQSSYFHDDLNIVDLQTSEGGTRELPSQEIEFIHQALVLGVRDFVHKTGFKKAHLGLSGGIDSALVACLVADAIGPQNLTCIALPTEFNSSESFDLAQKLTKNLGCSFHTVEINDIFKTSIATYEKTFGKSEFSLMHENLQARIRGDILMMFSNQNGSMLMTTGNKSEYATGYATLYGDMCGGLAPIADLTKKQVYDLSRYYNKEYELIPQRIIDREPSAELRPNQKDSDSLPDYDTLDEAVENLVCHKKSAQTEVEQWALKALFRSEFKRWQAPPILKVSEHAFGRGRRIPIAHKAFY